MAFYDWIITLDEEIEEIWKPAFNNQLTTTLVLFLLARYSLLSNCIAYSLNIFILGSDYVSVIKTIYACILTPCLVVCTFELLN